MHISPAQIKAFQKQILSWYAKNKRALPWRELPLSDTSFRDPYAILVSEVMAQQTQLSRVVPKYVEWMEKFPTLESLATAPTRDVLQYWSGLGYNRRALYLQKTAQQLVHKFGNLEIQWPQTEKELRQLPGIGEYTARAILCFAFNHQVAVVDTNVKKVILTHLKMENGEWKLDSENSRWKKSTINNLSSPFDMKSMTNREVQEIAEQLLPKGKAYEWNQALMDYAAAELKTHKIPVPKQSKFKDSDRYYRGQILKLLVSVRKINPTKLYQLLETNMPQERWQKILTSLEQDGFIKKNAKNVILV